MAVAKRKRRPIDVENRHFVGALLFAILIHATFGFVQLPDPPIPEAGNAPIEIAVVDAPPSAPERPPIPERRLQSVSPSDSPEQEPERETDLRSERASKTDHSTVHRGDPLAGAQIAKNERASRESPAKIERTPRRSEPAPRERAAEQRSHERPDPILRLDANEVADALRSVTRTADASDPSESRRREESEANTGSDEVRHAKFQRAEPFSKTSLRAALFPGKVGSADFLPNIPDGDVTLLNAKADKYSVFVRRVALQVFGALRKQSWQELPRNEIHAIRGLAVVEASMSKDGKLISAQITDQSGSRRFDTLLKSAAESGTWDQNPPASAASADGTIKFIFESRTWTRQAPGGIGEQRWILLGTGLQ